MLVVEDDLSGIHQRLGEVKNGEKGNVWVRNVNSRQKLAALSTGESETSGFKQNVHSFQVGADAAVPCLLYTPFAWNFHCRHFSPRIYFLVHCFVHSAIFDNPLNRL